MEQMNTASATEEEFSAAVAEWEEGQTRVATFLNKSGARVHVVRSDARGVYGVLRYFTIGGMWQVSADGIELDAEGVLPVLERVLK